MSNLPACCQAHIERYSSASLDYPKERAALCCRVCKARLTYTQGRWSREKQ